MSGASGWQGQLNCPLCPRPCPRYQGTCPQIPRTYALLLPVSTYPAPMLLAVPPRCPHTAKKSWRHRWKCSILNNLIIITDENGNAHRKRSSRSTSVCSYVRQYYIDIVDKLICSQEAVSGGHTEHYFD